MYAMFFLKFILSTNEMNLFVVTSVWSSLILLFNNTVSDLVNRNYKYV